MLFGFSITKVLTAAVVTLAFVALGMYSLWQHDRNKLKEAEGIIESQRGIITALEAVAVSEREVARVVQPVIEQIAESPNAEVLVPEDIASAWATGIDSLRDDKRRITGNAAYVQRPYGTTSGKRETNGSAVSGIFYSPRSCVPELQYQIGAGGGPERKLIYAGC